VFGTSFDPLLRHPDVFIDRVRWDVVLDQAPGAVAVIGLSVLGVLLITSAVEMSTERDGDANDELRAAGAANVVSGLGGGFVGYHSLSSTQIAHGMGAPASRVPGITCALAYVGALFVGPAPLAYVPKALIGGLLLFIGSSFCTSGWWRARTGFRGASTRWCF
jgi:SulP family sulfate permease